MERVGRRGVRFPISREWNILFSIVGRLRLFFFRLRGRRGLLSPKGQASGEAMLFGVWPVGRWRKRRGGALLSRRIRRAKHRACFVARQAQARRFRRQIKFRHRRRRLLHQAVGKHFFKRRAMFSRNNSRFGIKTIADNCIGEDGEDSSNSDSRRPLPRHTPKPGQCAANRTDEVWPPSPGRPFAKDDALPPRRAVSFRRALRFAPTAGGGHGMHPA